MNLTLPLPPSVNHMYVNRVQHGVTHGGRPFTRRARVLTPAAESYFEVVRLIAMREARKQGWAMTGTDTKVVVEMRFWFADRRTRDTHNGIKVVMDALESVVYVNDSYALPRVMDYDYDPRNPRLELVIRRFEGEADGGENDDV